MLHRCVSTRGTSCATLGFESFDFPSIFLPYLTLTGKFTTRSHIRNVHIHSTPLATVLFSLSSRRVARVRMRAHRSPTTGATGCARRAEWGKSVAAARQNVRTEWLKRKHRIIIKPDLEETRRVSRHLSSVEAAVLFYFRLLLMCDNRAKENNRET